MILRSKNCIFVHVPKAAGQSIEAALRSAVPRADGSPADLVLRKRGRDEPGPERLAHLTGTEYPELGYVSHEEYRAFFKFAFVRNPWDRAFSIFRHFGLDEYVSFEYFLEYILKRDMWREQYWFVRPQCDFVLNANGELCVDFLGRFETLQEDFRHVAAVLGLETTVLPHVNRSGPRWQLRKLRAFRRYPRFVRYWRQMFRAHTKGDRDRYSADALGIIGELYRCDIVQFDYQPKHSLAGSAV